MMEAIDGNCHDAVRTAAAEAAAASGSYQAVLFPILASVSPRTASSSIN
jgi:hypothetical protein